MADKAAENANEAFQTAKLTSYWLELAGLPEALEYAELIHLNQELDPAISPHTEDMCFLNPIIHEIRYGSINEFIEHSGCRGILDIACGYSPRGLLFARKGYHYVGADLPVVAEQLSQVVSELSLAGLDYVGADATNYASLRKAADLLEGPICIVVEGLGMYLNAAEAETLRLNIARLLSERPGSSFVTTDPGNGYLFHAVITSVYPPQRTMMTFGELFEMYNWASDGGITYETAKRPLEEDLKLFQEAGMDVTAVPLLPEGCELRCFRTLPEETVASLKKAIGLRLLFTATALEKDGAESAGTEAEEGFSLTADITDGVLRAGIRGRLDSLTAPFLLRCFEEHRSEISAVEIDLSETTYVSSAGNRSFYLIRKELGDDKALTLSGANETVSKLIADDGIISHLP